MAKKRTNSKKNQKRTDPTAGSKNSKSPPTSDVSRPTSRLSNPSDVENSGHKSIAVKKKDVFQKPMQVFGNRASQLNIPAKKNAEENKLIEQTPKTESWDNLLLKSPISSSCLDDADVHIRQVIAEFGNEMGGETARLKAIAEINYMIGSTSSFLQRFTIRNKLHSYGFFSALAAHIDSGLPSKMIAAEIETYLNSENRDARLVGLQGNDESPIEALAKLMSKVNDDQCREIVELLDFISNSNDIGGLLKNLTSHSNGSVLKESECQTDCAFMRSETKDNTSKVLSTCYDIPEESAVFCDYSTSDDDSRTVNSDPTTPDALNTNQNLKKWATAADLPSQATFGVVDSYLKSNFSNSAFSSDCDDDGPISPSHDMTLPAITEALDSSDETDASEIRAGLETTLPVHFSDRADIAFIDEASSTSSITGSLGFSEIMSMSFEMVDLGVPPISSTAPPAPPPPIAWKAQDLPPISSTAPPPPPPPSVPGIAPISRNIPPPPPPPLPSTSSASNLPPISSAAPVPPPPPMIPGTAPLSKCIPPPPPLPPSGLRNGPPPAPPLNLDMLKGAAAGLRSTTGGVPPPPPLPSFPFNGSSPNAFSPGTTTSPVLSPGVVKSAVVYRKQKKTAFVRWPKLTMLMQDAGTVFNDSLCVDFNEEERSKMEEIFEEAPVKQLNRKIGGSVGRAFGKSLRATTSSSDINTVSARSPTNPQILVSPKALTIEILIKKLKPLDFTELIEKMEKNETEGIKVDLMTTLNNNFPDKDELDPFLKVEYRSLTHASDQFCWHIARNKHLRLRIELFITKENVTAEIVKFQTQIETLQAGCKMSRGEIVQILLRKCLQYGNYLNQGSMFAEASGFQFSYLIQLLQMKGKGEHMSVRLVDLIVAFCDLPTSQVEEVHSKIMAARPLNLKDLEDAVAQVQRTIRKLDGQMRSSNVETLIASYQPFMDDTNEKLQNVLNGLSDVKNREMELQVYLCAGNMTLQAIFETLEQSTKIVSDAIKQAASKARVTRATSMVSLPTSSVPQRTLKEGEVLARKSIALKSRDLPVEELKKLFSHSSFGPQRGKRIPASPLTRTNTSPTRTIRRRSGESGRERADETTQREERSSVQTPSTPSTPIEPPSVASLRREIRDLSSLVGSPV